MHHVSCRVSCPVASSLALALPAALQKQQLVTSPRAAYHPRASSWCFSSRLQHVHRSASQLQRRQHTHSDSRAATFRDRKRTAVPTRSLTPHHSTKQCNKRHVAIAKAKTLKEAQQTQLKRTPCKQNPNTHARTPNCDKIVLDGPGEARQGYSATHESDTTLSSSCQNEQQTTSGMEFLHIYDTRGM